MAHWISLPIDDGQRMPLSRGDVRMVRLADGEELEAIWDSVRGDCCSWFRRDDDGDMTGDGLDVVAVQSGPPERKYGNRSGRHANPRRKLSASPEAYALMDQAAERTGESWTEWARGALAMAVAEQLGLDESETIDLFDCE